MKDLGQGEGLQPFGRCDSEQGAVFGANGLISKELATRDVVAHEPATLWSLSKPEFERTCGMSWESRMHMSLKVMRDSQPSVHMRCRHCS